MPTVPPVLQTSAERIQSIINNTPATFNVSNNPNANPIYGEWRAINDVGISQTSLFGNIIVQEAAAQGVNANLVKAIMYVENSQGFYGHWADPLALSHSIFPMNINPAIWDSLVSGGDFSDPTINIRAAVTLIKRIQDRVSDPTPEKIATLYNSLSQETVLDYGARVKNVMDNQLWNNPAGYDYETASEHFGITTSISNIWDSIHIFDQKLENTGETFLESISFNIAKEGGLNNALLKIFGAGVITDPSILNAPTSTTNYFSIGNNAGSGAGESLDLSLTSDYLDGLAVRGNNWQINLPGSVLNTDGLSNVAPSSFLNNAANDNYVYSWELQSVGNY